MTYDPFQTNPTAGQYYGMPAPINLQYGVPQASAVNPAAAFNPLAANLSPGISQFGQPVYQGIPIQGGISPQQIQQQQQLQQQHQQQLQLAQILASQAGVPQLFGASPWAMGLQNPLLAVAFQNALASVLNPALNPQLGWQQHVAYPQIGSNGSPFGQTGGPLAPQSWVGPTGQFGGQQFGQVHPLMAQANARQFHVPVNYPGAY